MTSIYVHVAMFITWVSVTGSTIGCLHAADSSRHGKFTEQLQPLLQTYCVDCHDTASEVVLSVDSPDAMTEDRDTWIRALAQVRLGTMPPSDGEPMDASARLAMGELIDELANAVDCVRHPNAGRVALRRLNRHEYRNTIRDLTGVNYSPAVGFPGDDVGYGFDNIGDVLSLPPILMEKYLDAAEEITGRAIYTPPPARTFALDRQGSTLVGSDKYKDYGNGLVISGNGSVTLEKDLPFGGDYRLIVTASGQQAGNQPCRMRVQVGRATQMFDVPNDAPKPFVVPMHLARGKRSIAIGFTNDFYDSQTRADRNLRLHHVRLEGIERRSSVIASHLKPKSHDHLIFVTPDRNLSAESATGKVLSRFASRAFRRPATSGEIRRLSMLAQQVRREGGSFEESIQVAMQAVLVSPHFIFRVEHPNPPSSGGPMPPITQYELASRLSYFLWSSMPDDELLMLAHRGQLRDRSVLLRKVASMLRDKRSSRFVRNFAGQWLQLRNLDNVEMDPRLYVGFDAEVKRLMAKETLLFFESVMRENQPITTLLDGQYTFLNERLARHYNIGGVSGPQFRRVSLEGTERGGLLTQGSVLTVTSNPTRTSPVKRGKFILDNLLNMPPPPAPPNIPELDKGPLTGTLRERMQQHREDPACATCHSMMDPLGFALENFDAVGRYRTLDGPDLIDASGELPDGTEFAGVRQLKELLAKTRRDQFVRAVTEKMLIYAIGRGTEYYDKCAIDRIVEDAAVKEYRFAYIIAGIVASDPFQKQGVR